MQRRTRLPAALADRCIATLQRPLPRVELGLELRLRGLANAAIDVSDGLLADLGHIVESSAVAAEIFVAQLPSLPAGADPVLARRCQLAGGDDYELLFSAPPASRPAIADLAARLELPLWRCGRLRGAAAIGLTLLDENGQALTIDERGFDHFG